MAFGTNIEQGICWNCTKQNWSIGDKTVVEANHWYLANKVTLNQRFGYNGDIPAEVQQHCMKMGMKGTYYLVRLSEDNIEFDKKYKNESGTHNVAIEFCCALGKCKRNIRAKNKPY